MDGREVLTIAAIAADLGVINDLGWSTLLASDVPTNETLIQWVIARIKGQIKEFTQRTNYYNIPNFISNFVHIVSTSTIFVTIKGNTDVSYKASHGESDW